MDKNLLCTKKMLLSKHTQKNWKVKLKIVSWKKEFCF